VSKTNDVLQARRNLSSKYGNPKDKHWPILADGSKMRFVPIFKSYVKNKKVYEHLNDMLWIQAKSKAHDVLLDLNITDIHEKKVYLNNQSMEQILHLKTSGKMKAAPIIKHIIRKWSRTPETVEYQAAINPYMLEEAQALLITLKNELTREYGNEVLQHFKNKYYQPYRKSNTTFNTNNVQDEDDYDEELVNDMLQTHTTDPYTKVLIDGLDMLNKEDEIVTEPTTKENDRDNKEQENSTKRQEKVSTSNQINEEENKRNKEQVYEKKENSEDNDENTKLSDTSFDAISGISIGITTTGQTVEWDNLTVKSEIDGCKPATKKEVEKIERTVLKYNITTTETEKWKNENYMEYDMILEEANGREYEIMKRLIKEILAKRIENREREKEEEKLQEMIDKTEDEVVEETYIRDEPNLRNENVSSNKDIRKHNITTDTFTQRITRSRGKQVSFRK